MDIKIAVISPFKNESPECIQQCIDNVSSQSYPVGMHIIICDGAEFPSGSLTLPQHVHVIQLPQGCEDTGATPRAIGSIYAIAHFCHAIAYLDIDNLWTNDHLQNAVDFNRKGADVVISDRWICHHESGENLYIDDFEHAITVVDTNTIVLFGKAMIPGSQWWRIPRKKGERTAGVDRYAWDHIVNFVKHNNLRIMRTRHATSLYVSRWLHHYTRINLTPPSPAKTLTSNNGMIVALWVE